MYWIEHVAPSEGKSVVMSPAENSASIHATTNVDAIHAADIPPNPSTAAMSAIIRQRGFPEDNIIVARDSQSGRRAC
jgi:hypothetical protein